MQRTIDMAFSRTALIIAGLAVGLLLSGSVGCSRQEKPTAEECIGSLKNGLRLRFGSDPARAERMIKQSEAAAEHFAGICVNKRKRSEVVCEGKASTLAELKACRKK